MGTAQFLFVEDLTIAHAWPEVTLPEVTWLPLTFPPYFPVIFFSFFFA
jgi:transglutaminase-like putative cysteine protease